MFATLAGAAAVEPFKFESTADDHDSQQAEWDLLIKYKLFGTGVETASGSIKGIYFNGQQIYITDSIGFVGSAKGNLDMSGNIRHSVGGPMLFGGNFVDGDGFDTLMTGPTRFNGNFTVNFNAREKNEFHGYNCIGGTANDLAVTDIKAHGTLLSAEECATEEKVPFVDTKLEIPVLDNPSAVYQDAISVSGQNVYIDVPPYSGTGDKVYDIYIKSINFGNAGKLYIRMPQNGRLTRIFLEETITGLGSTAGTNIEVLHAFGGGVFEGDGKEYAKDQWNGSAWDYTAADAKNVISNLDYAGNLLFYTPKTISMGAGQKNLQGTYIMGEDLVIAQNTTFAGQFLARSIQIDAEFKAKDFRYVPFDPPVIRVGANSDLYEEHDLTGGDTIRLVLDSVPPTVVPFRYCFEFLTKGRNAATRDDLSDATMPICSEGDTVSSKFEKGSKTPIAPIILHASNDGTPENTESFRMYVCDVEAAVFPDGDRQGRCFPFSIKIIDGTPIPADTTFYVNENVKAKTAVGTVKTAKNVSDPQFKIIDDSGLFDVNEKGAIVVKKDSTLNFEEGNIYTVKVIRLDGTTAKDTADIYIYVNDVNEPPSIRDTVYQIYENAATDTTVGVLPYFDEDEEDSGFRKNSYSLVGGDSAYFSIDAATGTIKAKKSFDYEALSADNKFYTVTVKISDPDGYSSTASVKIEILDVMEKSEIVVTLVESDNGDTKVEKPTGTVNMNVNAGVISWTADGKTMPDTVLTNLREGKNVVTLYYMDSTKNEPVTKDVVIFVCTKTPEVTLSTDSNNVKASNIYTVVEKIADDDTTFYVNKSKKELVIEVKEPILDSTYTDSTCNYKTTPVKVTIDLDTVKTPSAALKDLGSVASTKIALDESRAGATHTLYNDSLILVSYKDKVDGKEVTVSYLTNSKGDMIEDNFKVSYETTVDGKTVTVSYEADAATGEPVKNKEGVVFEVSYTKDDVTVAYQVDASGKVIKDDTGNVGYNVTFSYTSEFGNKASKSIYVVVDEIKPKVEIKSPVNDQVIHSNMVEVEWYVDYGDGNGPQLQTELVTQGLTKGPNVIVRYYMDKAGNADADTVFVIMKDAKDVDISVVTPVTIITQEKVDEYYAANELKKGQTYAVTIYNSKTDKEVETLTGGSYKAKEGSGEEPYPGLEGHLGPTLAVDVKVPSINAVGGMATLDDMMDENGMVLLEDVDAGGKATVDEYIQQYCSADFATAYASDPSRANLYDTKMKVEIWVFTSLGSFVDYFTFTQEMNNPDYANDAGLLTMYFEQKPDKDGNVRTKDGRLYGTGAYVYKTVVTMKSKLQCTLYPESEAPQKMGMVRKVSDDLLKPFGYKRPEEK